MVRLNFADIQGNILRGYNFGAGLHCFVTVPDVDRGRSLLRAILAHVTDARDWGSERPVVATNIALTHTGLKALGVDPELLAALPEAFRDNITTRAERLLGDRGESNPEKWDPIGSTEVHMLVLFASSETPRGSDDFKARYPSLAHARTWLDHYLERHGATLVYKQEVEALKKRREHFGYADGFGQPAVEGASGSWPGQGVPERKTGAWRDIKAGEFILGYPNEDGEQLSVSESWLLRNGSFMVYRKLEQNVPEFRNAVAARARDYVATNPRAIQAAEPPLSAHAPFEVMAAKLVGRWRDGLALELHPERKDLNKVGDLEQEMDPHLGNNFRYGGDRDGYACPRGAHIRRANPRDLLGSDEQESRRHRIIRRGMPYGPPYQAGKDAQKERGLIFMCFNADLERQFEVVQGQWCADGNVFGLGNDQDYLLGNQPDRKVTIEGEPPFFVASQPDLVVTKGCQYLLMPGLGALHHLSAPRWDKAASLESVPEGEADATTRVVGRVVRGMREDYASERPMRRGQHPKSHGCVTAKFIVEGVPEDLKIGLFANPGPYDAWIRFSASHSAVQSDKKLDAQGMAIKVKGVDGEKVLPRGRCLDTQDFMLVSHESFFLRDALDVAEFAEAITHSGSLSHLSPLVQARALEFFVMRRNLRGLCTLLRMLSCSPVNPVYLNYWSETPYALQSADGRFSAVKYKAQPRQSDNDAEPTKPRYDSLEDALADALKEGAPEVSFDFLVQRREEDPHTMPVEDPTVKWDDSKAPYRKVARIVITPPQPVTNQHRRNLGENLVFSPWHSLWEHRPLGGINRVRRAVYEASNNLRHELNNAHWPREGDTLLDCGELDEALFLGRRLPSSRPNRS
jgi:Dyp-type peroxidase family